MNLFWTVSRVSRRQKLSCFISARYIHDEKFTRLSKFWTPTGWKAQDEGELPDSNELLLRAGYIKQTHAGIFQLMPLGLRVQEKIEHLIDKHMKNLGASKVSLSTFSSEELWKASGRLQGDRSELFSLQDRKGSRFLLSPTHEEEITSLVKGFVHSYKGLPVRLYQVTRKYRDEPRPRQGLLRTREFLMKDLYTFDATLEAALQTYQEVQVAYRAFFNDLKLPTLVAAADSGNIGGDLSHEYHIISSKGEDEVLECEQCNLSYNEEVLRKQPKQDVEEEHNCPKCSGQLKSYPTIELGHTFHLGTKYSQPLDAMVATPEQTKVQEVKRPIEMGCHGIGISRLIAGIANHLSDHIGLIWSRAVAPFDLVIMQSGSTDGAALELARLLSGNNKFDVLLDDRQKSLVWKMKDADLIGYPLVVILGRSWEQHGKVEIQCRRLGIKEEVEWASVPEKIGQILDKC